MSGLNSQLGIEITKNPLVFSPFVQEENNSLYPFNAEKYLLTENGLFILTESLQYLLTE